MTFDMRLRLMIDELHDDAEALGNDGEAGLQKAIIALTRAKNELRDTARYGWEDGPEEPAPIYLRECLLCGEQVPGVMSAIEGHLWIDHQCKCGSRTFGRVDREPSQCSGCHLLCGKCYEKLTPTCQGCGWTKDD